ncbi:N-acetylglucosaminidase [Oceanobacillus sp. CAU 1775]
MRKTALFLISLLLFSMVSPYNLSAQSLDFSEEADTNEFIEYDSENDSIDIDEDKTGTYEEDSLDVIESEDSEIEEVDDAKANPTPATEENDQNNKEVTEEVEEKDNEDTNIEQDIEINEEEVQANVSSAAALTVQESSTSRLGHIRNADVDLYENINNLSISFKAGETHTNAVYYIKRQAVVNGQTYYLLSTLPSAVNGVVGWAKSSDLSTHAHSTLDKQTKNLYVKGTGSAFEKAWGGSKDRVYQDMSKFTGYPFKVNLTEKVGNNTWYRGYINGERIWLHSAYVATEGIDHKSVSKLGHLRSNATIYERIGDPSSVIDTAPYLNAVYYIKREATFNNQKYYLISTLPSSTNGTIGWVKSNELSTHNHRTVDKKAKTLYFKGTGSAFTKAWGGSQDAVHPSMSPFAGEVFKINLTETVGNNTWYRGVHRGETIWLHSSYLTTKSESNTSRLGHLRANATIFKTFGDANTIVDSENLQNAVYYIKKEAKVHNETFYLISNQPSSTNGTVGWVNAKELSTHTHRTVDKKSKVFYANGLGSSYTKAWGGARDLVYEDLSVHAGEYFDVNLTEKVGNNTWYRGVMNGETMWIHSAHVAEQITNYQNYDLTLNEALDIQLTARPQTDKHYNTFVSKAYIDSNNKVTADTLNVRGGAGTNFWVVGQLKKGATVSVLGEVGGWYQIEYTRKHQWVNPSPADVAYYLNPNSFINDDRQKFQFLDLTKSSNASATVLNNYLRGKGTLHGQGQAFIDASRTHGINDIYLISHAILETGHGASTLAQGVQYNGVTVYNMFGIGAYDSCPVNCGAQRAYEEGWTTPALAIVGGAKFIGSSYVRNGQNTLYKMRWNPAAMALTGKYGRQYATDIGWASKQVSTMYNLYQTIGIYNLNLEIPVYKR